MLFACIIAFFALLALLALIPETLAIPVNTINPLSGLPPVLYPYANESTRQQTTLFTLLFPTNQTLAISQTIASDLFNRIIDYSGGKASRENVFNKQQLIAFINQTVVNGRKLRNGTLYQIPPNSTILLAAQLQMDSIGVSNQLNTVLDEELNVTRQMFSWYLMDKMRQPFYYWRSICDGYWLAIRQCVFRKPFNYYWHRNSISFIRNACLDGLTALGGWRIESCVLQSLRNASDPKSIKCSQAVECFRPKITPPINLTAPPPSLRELPTALVPAFGGAPYSSQLFTKFFERLTVGQQELQRAHTIGQRSIFGTYVELFFQRLSKRNYWIYYASYTAIGTGLFVLFALIFPVYSLMLGVGGIVTNVFLLAGNHIFSNMLLGYEEIKEQDAAYNLSPIILEAS